MARPAFRRFVIAGCCALTAAALTAYDDPLAPLANEVQQAMHEAAHDTLTLAVRLDHDIAAPQLPAARAWSRFQRR